MFDESLTVVEVLMKLELCALVLCCIIIYLCSDVTCVAGRVHLVGSDDIISRGRVQYYYQGSW